MTVFRPKIDQFSKIFKILLDIDKTHKNTFLVKNLDGLEHFWPFCDLYGADVDIYTKNSPDNSRFDETMQKVLALIVKLWRIFQKKFWGSKISKI